MTGGTPKASFEYIRIECDIILSRHSSRSVAPANPNLLPTTCNSPVYPSAYTRGGAHLPQSLLIAYPSAPPKRGEALYLPPAPMQGGTLCRPPRLVLKKLSSSKPSRLFTFFVLFIKKIILLFSENPNWGVPPQIDRGLTRTHLRF